MTIRIVLVDDQEMYRLGFRMLLETREEVEVIGEAEDGRAAVELISRVEADVVLRHHSRRRGTADGTREADIEPFTCETGSRGAAAARAEDGRGRACGQSAHRFRSEPISGRN